MKRYADPSNYEEKLERVMRRLGVDRYNYDWSRFACWVEFWVNDQYYRFDHSVENAKAHGQSIRYGSDVFAQVVLTLEDIARMTERGIYELQTWISGLKALPPAAEKLPKCMEILGFETIPTQEEVIVRYKQLAKTMHPDAGGTEEEFLTLKNAKDDALIYLGDE